MNKRFALILILVVGFWLLSSPAQAGLRVERPSDNLDAGLVGYWPFNGPDVAGNVAYDRSGQGNNGTMVNSPLKVIGKVGQGLQFLGPGVDTYISVPHKSSINLTSSMTLTFWVKPASNITYDWTRLMEKNYSTGYYIGSGTGTNDISYWLNDTEVFDTADNVLSVGKWQHLAVTFDDASNEVILYIDGNSHTVTSYTGTITGNTSALQFTESGNRCFNGTMDEVRIYTRALSADEVKRLYNIGKGVSTAASQQNKQTLGLVGYWTFDGPDISGTTAYDRSGQGNNGTINGPVKAGGKIGQGLNFSQNTHRVTMSGPDLGNTYTLSAWFNIRSFPSSWSSLISQDNNNAFCLSNTNKVSFYYSSTDHLNNTAINFNQWHHAAVVTNSGNVTFYLDGAADGTATGAPALNLRYIGTDVSQDTLDGKIDEVRVYNRALSADEIKALYNQAGSKFHASQENQLTTGLVGYWPFNGPDISGTTAYDRSGQGNNGTLTNFPLNVAATTLVASDNFNRSNGGLGSNWTTVTGTADPVIKSNKVNLEDESSGLHCAYWNANSFDSNQYAQAKFPNSPNGTNYGPAVAVRLSSERGYILWWGNSDDKVSIWRMDNSGSWTELQSASGLTIANTDVWRLVAVGSTLIGYQNGNFVVEATDGTYTGGSPGIWLYYPVNQLDDWEGGNVSPVTKREGMSPGKLGQALRYNGSDYVDMGDIDQFDGLTRVTVSAWVKSNTIGGATNEVHFVDKSECDGQINSGPFELGAGFWTSNKAYFVVYPADSSFVSSGTSSTSIDDMNWHHVVGIYDGSDISIWVDGVRENFSSPGSFTLSSNSKGFSIGGYCDGHTFFWNGLIDEVRVYNRALSADEVKRLYNLGR
jgi:hypothetical protein